MMRERCYILGSGGSLANLTDAQKIKIQQSGRVLALNKYLLFYRKVGLIPDYLVVKDHHYPAPRVVARSLDIIKKDGLETKILLNEYYRPFFDPVNLYLSMRRRMRFMVKHRYFFPFYGMRNIDFFKNSEKEDVNDLKWANSFSEELCYYRGTLTTALNLVHILWPTCDVVLLGVDLNKRDAFYQSEFESTRWLRDKFSNIGQEEGVHATAATVNNLPGISVAIKCIVNRLACSGINVSCANSDSLLVLEGICDVWENVVVSGEGGL